MDELVALYADGLLDGRVTGAAPRSRVRAENLPHAATAVLLKDTLGRLYVHRRTDTKDVFPGMHDCCAGGVILAGEDPAEAATRELAEELGVHGCLPRECFRFWYADACTRYLVYYYDAVYDPAAHGPIVHQPSEVASGEWLAWDDLMARLADPGWQFVPDGRAGIERYAAHLLRG